MGRAYLSLGSNIEADAHLRSAIAALRARFGDVQVSPVYRTVAVGFVGAEFLNAAAIIDSDLDPFALNDWLHALEAVSYTHLRAHETVLDLVCRLLLENKQETAHGHHRCSVEDA